MPYSKKAQLSHSLWEVIELMVAAVMILLVVWIAVMAYNSLIAKPQEEAQAKNAFDAIYNTINELMASKQQFAATVVDVQLPDGYIIAFFDKDKIMDTCSDELWHEGEDEETGPTRIYKSLVKAHCTPPCMCYYYEGDSRAVDFFKDNNNPDHKECKQLPTGISNIITWYDKELKSRYIEGTEGEVFARNIKGDMIQLQGYPNPVVISYSNVLIYGKCEEYEAARSYQQAKRNIEFGLRQLYLDKAEIGKENQKKSVIFLSGKTYLTDLKNNLTPAYLNMPS